MEWIGAAAITVIVVIVADGIWQSVKEARAKKHIRDLADFYEAKYAELGSWREVCRRTAWSNCYDCEDPRCGDNVNPAFESLRRKQLEDTP